MTTTPLPTDHAGRYTGPRFSTILVDPPWSIEQKGARGAINHYPLMTLERIKQLPIAQIAEDNAHLWLWVTNATLRIGYDVAEAWGFTVRSPLTWTKNDFRLGMYLRNATEHVLFATRGKAPVHFRSQGTWLLAPRQEHSRKPEELFAIIERVSGPGPKLEMFARRRPPFPGWSVWGNEVDSDIVVPGFPVSQSATDELSAA